MLVAASAAVYPILDAATNYSYTNDIKPVFANECSGCHDWEQAYSNVVGPKSDYSPTKGLKIVYPSKPDSSVLVWRLEGKLPSGATIGSMPQGGNKLPDATIQMIRAWITQGAPENAAVLTILPPSNVKVSDMPGDNGHALKITWSLSPSESGGGVSWYRIFRSRSGILTDPVPLTRFASFDSLNSWDAHYTILIDSVAAGISQYVDSGVFYNSTQYYYWLQAAGPGAASNIVASGISSSVNANPAAFSVAPAFPNPFNPSTTIAYRLPSGSEVTVRIFNCTGQKVMEHREEFVQAGDHAFIWNAAGMSSGVYVFTVRAGIYAGSGKMLLVR